MSQRPRLCITIESDLKKILEEFAARNNLNISEAICDCLRRQLQDEEGWDLLWRRLNRLEKKVYDVRDRTDITMEAVGLSAFYFFAQTPDIPSEEGDEAHKVAQRRYIRYVQALKKTITSKNGLIERLDRDFED